MYIDTILVYLLSVEAIQNYGINTTKDLSKTFKDLPTREILFKSLLKAMDHSRLSDNKRMHI